MADNSGTESWAPYYWDPSPDDLAQFILLEAAEGQDLPAVLMAATATISPDPLWSSRRQHVPRVSAVARTLLSAGWIVVRDATSDSVTELSEAHLLLADEANWWRPLYEADHERSSTDLDPVADWRDHGGYDRYSLDTTDAGLTMIKPIPTDDRGRLLPPWLR